MFQKMLDGWYCRSIANMQANEAASASNNAPQPQGSRGQHEEYSSDSSSDGGPEPNYRAQYLTLKKKLKHLIYVSTYDRFLLSTYYYYFNRTFIQQCR